MKLYMKLKISNQYTQLFINALPDDVINAWKIDDDKFSLVTTDFIATGGDGNNTFIGLEYTVCGDSLQAFIDYFETMENITESTIQMDRQIPV